MDHVFRVFRIPGVPGVILESHIFTFHIYSDIVYVIYVDFKCEV